MVLKLPWAQKRIFWAFEKKVWKPLKPFSWKVRLSVKIFLNQNLRIRTFFENGFEATLSSKTNVQSVWKEHFQFLANFWVTKLKPFTGNSRQCYKNFFDKIYFVESILENAFQSWFDQPRQSWLEVLNILNVFECCHLNIQLNYVNSELLKNFVKNLLPLKVIHK